MPLTQVPRHSPKCRVHSNRSDSNVLLQHTAQSSVLAARCPHRLGCCTSHECFQLCDLKSDSKNVFHGPILVRRHHQLFSNVIHSTQLKQGIQGITLVDHKALAPDVLSGMVSNWPRKVPLKGTVHRSCRMCHGRECPSVFQCKSLSLDMISGLGARDPERVLL